MYRRKRHIRNSGVSFFRQFIGEVRCQANVCDSAECVCTAAATVLLDAISNPEMVVFIQLLHGFCFAVMWVAAVQYAKANAPRKLQNTSQTVMSNVWVVGNGCGSFFWSFLYDRFDSFRICYIAGALIVGCLSYYTFKCWNVKVNRVKQ